MSMRWTIYLIIVTVLLSGCQAFSRLTEPTETALIPIMPLWQRYQRCSVSSDLQELVVILGQLEGAMQTGTEPPSWMKGWGHHVMSQPLRTAVDPNALTAACMLRTAARLVAADRVAQARTLYEHLLSRYSSAELAYYADRAKEALISLPASDPSLIALRAQQTLSH
jgi:hypothetical protein